MHTTLGTNPLFQRWYAVYVRSRHEKCAAMHFSLKSVEYFFPTYKDNRKWKNGCRVQLDRPLFPGYLFTRIVLSERLFVLRCPGVIRFVGANHEPSPIEDQEIDSLRLGQLTYLARPHPYITTGDRVIVRRGPFEGRVGILVRHDSSFRVVISMDLLKRAMSVELDLADVELMPADAVQRYETCYGQMQAYSH